jgi:hypothetical protein
VKNSAKQYFRISALACALVAPTAFAQSLPTTGSIDTSIGHLEIKNGYAQRDNPLSL